MLSLNFYFFSYGLQWSNVMFQWLEYLLVSCESQVRISAQRPSILNKVLDKFSDYALK